MVYYFSSNTVSPAAFIYVGKDKFENEELIKYGLEEDVCAHIYLRLNEGEALDNIPKALLTDCAQLTKANSIEGNKKDNVTVIYTPWSNLVKNGSMAVGEVGYKDSRMVKKILVPKQENPIINRLNKTKVEKFPNLGMEKAERLKEKAKKNHAAAQTQRKKEARIAQEHKQMKHQKEHMYDDLFTEENMQASSNQNRSEGFLDDFM